MAKKAVKRVSAPTGQKRQSTPNDKALHAKGEKRKSY